MKMYAFANCNEYKVLKRKATNCDMSFRSGNIEITDTELIVYGYYFCFGSCSAKRVSLSDIRTVREIETTLQLQNVRGSLHNNVVAL